MSQKRRTKEQLIESIMDKLVGPYGAAAPVCIVLRSEFPRLTRPGLVAIEALLMSKGLVGSKDNKK